jgi:hypothetical protein
MPYCRQLMPGDAAMAGHAAASYTPRYIEGMSRRIAALLRHTPPAATPVRHFASRRRRD